MPGPNSLNGLNEDFCREGGRASKESGLTLGRGANKHLGRRKKEREDPGFSRKGGNRRSLRPTELTIKKEKKSKRKNTGMTPTRETRTSPGDDKGKIK